MGFYNNPIIHYSIIPDLIIGDHIPGSDYDFLVIVDKRDK